MATTQHYLWAGGHFLLLVSALRCLIAMVTFKSIGTLWYKASFLGALVSYAIVCHKSLGPHELSAAHARKVMAAIVDENVQYLLLAFFWWSSRPVYIALVPYFIFSLFHALTFTRTTLMPRFLPTPPAPTGTPPQPHPLAKRLQLWVKANYDKAMRLVAYTELLVFVRVVFGALILRNSFAAPLVYAHFLRQRYYHSAFTRDAVAKADARLTEIVGRVGISMDRWNQARELIGRWAAGPLQAARPRVD